MFEKEITDLFIELVKFDTQSNENSQNYPSTESQREFAQLLLKKCEEYKFKNINIDKYGYVSAEIDSNIDYDVKTIGFISHMDTSPDCSGKNINPMIIKNYDGKDIKLLNNVNISPDEFASLKNYIGHDIITSDGNTLLGADDKAGIAEILIAMKYLTDNDNIKHGKIKIVFTPDEEIGKGVDYFDAEKFDCDFAYTIDGGEIGELSYENFNAARAIINIKGKSVHPGYAKNIMVNACFVANQICNMLPENETPSDTEGYEGYFHVSSINGNVENAKINIIIRDFCKEKFNQRKLILNDIIKKINLKYKNNIADIKIYDEYYNMSEIIEKNKFIIDLAYNSMIETNIKPLVIPTRGGTDGARLSFMGIPCPNLFAGGHNFHGPYEFIPISSMAKACELIIKICTNNTKLNSI